MYFHTPFPLKETKHPVLSNFPALRQPYQWGIYFILGGERSHRDLLKVKEVLCGHCGQIGTEKLDSIGFKVLLLFLAKVLIPRQENNIYGSLSQNPQIFNISLKLSTVAIAGVTVFILRPFVSLLRTTHIEKWYISTSSSSSSSSNSNQSTVTVRVLHCTGNWGQRQMNYQSNGPQITGKSCS